MTKEIKINSASDAFSLAIHLAATAPSNDKAKECLEYAKNIKNCKKVISAFSNNDVSNLAAYLKNRLKIKGYKVGRSYVTRYKSDCDNRSKAGVDMISIEIDKPKKAYKEDFVNKFNIRDFNFAKENNFSNSWYEFKF